jgi:hypothetical protein
MLFDFRQIVLSRVMLTRHLVRPVRALHHVNRQGSIKSMCIMMWQMLAVLMVGAAPTINYGLCKFHFRVHSGHSLYLVVFKYLNICSFLTLNPAKFWVRGEASIKEEAGIMMMSAGN